MGTIRSTLPLPNASALQKEFVSYYFDRYKEAPHWEADRAYFALAAYKAGVEAAHKAAGKWPKTEEIIAAIPGLKYRKPGRAWPLPQRQDRRADVLSGPVDK